jgi:hypothetical protein
MLVANPLCWFCRDAAQLVNASGQLWKIDSETIDQYKENEGLDCSHLSTGIKIFTQKESKYK